MIKIVWACLFVVSLALLIAFPQSPAGASDARRDILVTPDGLAEHLGDPSIVVLQVADLRLDYLREHIPGSRFLWPGWLEKSTPELNTELFPVAVLDSVLESLGVSDESLVVLCHSYTASSAVGVARAWATLDYLGMGERAKILDGGFEAWKVAGKPTTRDVGAFTKGSLTPRVKEDVFVDAEHVRSRMGKPGVRVVDVRRPVDYRGDPKSVLPGGHIPYAVNLPSNTIFFETRYYAPIDTLRARFAAAGIQPDEEAIFYCYRGRSACLAYVAAAMLGHKAHVYDGSFEEWWGRGDMPVEIAPAGK